MNVPRVLLWGGRSQSRLIEEMLRESGQGVAAVVFDATLAQPAYDSAAHFCNNVQGLKTMLGDVSHYVVCIGAEHGYARVRTAEALEQLGLIPLSVVHHRAFIEPSATVDSGVQVMPGAMVHKFSRVGDQTILNTRCTIDHECQVGRGVHIMGNAAIAGRVVIDDFATIGTNATVLPDLRIGRGAFVGAGAVVTHDVPACTVVAGVPARPTGRQLGLRCREEELLEIVGK